VSRTSFSDESVLVSTLLACHSRVMASILISVLALLVAIASAGYTRAQWRLNRDRDHRDKMPALTITRVTPPNGTVAIYAVRNDSAEDLRSVVVQRPVVNNGIVYPISRTGAEATNGGDTAEVGPIAAGQEGRFSIIAGERPSAIPEMRVVIDCAAEDGKPWRLLPVQLESPWRIAPTAVNLNQVSG